MFGILKAWESNNSFKVWKTFYSFLFSIIPQYIHFFFLCSLPTAFSSCSAILTLFNKHEGVAGSLAAWKTNKNRWQIVSYYCVISRTIATIMAWQCFQLSTLHWFAKQLRVHSVSTGRTQQIGCTSTLDKNLNRIAKRNAIPTHTQIQIQMHPQSRDSSCDLMIFISNSYNFHEGIIIFTS